MPLFNTATNTRMISPEASAPEYITITDIKHNRVQLQNDTEPNPTAPNNKEEPIIKVEPSLLSCSRRSSSSLSRSSSIQSLIIGAAIVSNIYQANGCDTTLFFQNNGKICNENECTNLNMYNFPVTTGSIVCFKDFSDNKLSVKIVNTMYRNRYQAVYHTSEVNITHDSISECKSANSQCWNKKCKPGEAHESLINLKNNKVNNSLEVTGYSCDADSVGCDSWCWHQVQCTWYSWSVKPHGIIATVAEIKSLIEKARNDALISAEDVGMKLQHPLKAASDSLVLFMQQKNGQNRPISRTQDNYYRFGETSHKKKIKRIKIFKMMFPYLIPLKTYNSRIAQKRKLCLRQTPLMWRFY